MGVATAWKAVVTLKTRVQVEQMKLIIDASGLLYSFMNPRNVRLGGELSTLHHELTWFFGNLNTHKCEGVVVIDGGTGDAKMSELEGRLKKKLAALEKGSGVARPAMAINILVAAAKRANWEVAVGPGEADAVIRTILNQRGTDHYVVGFVVCFLGCLHFASCLPDDDNDNDSDDASTEQALPTASLLHSFTHITHSLTLNCFTSSPTSITHIDHSLTHSLTSPHLTHKDRLAFVVFFFCCCCCCFCFLCVLPFSGSKVSPDSDFLFTPCAGVIKPPFALRAGQSEPLTWDMVPSPLAGLCRLLRGAPWPVLLISAAAAGCDATKNDADLHGFRTTLGTHSAHLNILNEGV